MSSRPKGKAAGSLLRGVLERIFLLSFGLGIAFLLLEVGARILEVGTPGQREMAFDRPDNNRVRSRPRSLERRPASMQSLRLERSSSRRLDRTC